MRYTSEMVEFKSDGRETYVKKSSCALVRYWASKYGAKVKVAWISKEGGDPLLSDSNVECVASIVPGSEFEQGDTVWAVPSTTPGASHDASLIKRLVSTASAKEYAEIRQDLSAAGYPDNILDAVPVPE